MFNRLKERRYRTRWGIAIADIILIIFRQHRNVRPVENINFSYGYSYYFFMAYPIEGEAHE